MDADHVDPRDIDLPFLEMTWEFDALDAINATWLGRLVSWMWGRSAQWGLLSEVDIACLGGTPEFMASVAQRLGGREVMRRRFLLYEEHEWFVPEEKIDRVMRVAGWSRVL